MFALVTKVCVVLCMLIIHAEVQSALIEAASGVRVLHSAFWCISFAWMHQGGLQEGQQWQCYDKSFRFLST